MTNLAYTVTLTRPDGTVVKSIEIPVLQETADASGNASSRLDFTSITDFTERHYAEVGLRNTLRGLGDAACGDANDVAIAAAKAAVEGS